MVLNVTFTVENLQKLVELEAMHGAPSQYTSTLSQLIDYYRKAWQFSLHIIIFSFIIWNVCCNQNNTYRSVFILGYIGGGNMSQRAMAPLKFKVST